jgi:methionine synthase II (cobalamin-independent)
MAMTGESKITGAHLVGSAPVQDAEDMFRLSMTHMGENLKRLPDGEAGERDTWIRWQHAKIDKSEQMVQIDRENVYVPRPPFAVAAGIESAEQIEFPNLGYADAAIESFSVFQKLSDEGVITKSMRFQVGLPTPLSVAIFYVESGSRNLFEQAYKRALKQELLRMLEHIPAESLSIQWETVSEFGILEGLMENHLEGDLMEEITSRVADLVDLVPEPVEVGIHLCYGDSGHKHFCEPKDADYLAQVTFGVVSKAKRNIAWIHMPVPRERDDSGYFAPLAGLTLPDSTELYLGLVHHTGGKEATMRRIRAASSIVPRFGLATECGLGRRARDTIPELMRQHAELIVTS